MLIAKFLMSVCKTIYILYLLLVFTISGLAWTLFTMKIMICSDISLHWNHVKLAFYKRYKCWHPRDRGAWWAPIYGVAQSWTGLKRLSSRAVNFTWFNLILICHKISNLPLHALWILKLGIFKFFLMRS